MDRLNLVFSLHAAQRWFERCGNLNYREEVSTLRRDKRAERLGLRRGKGRAKMYRTKNNAILVVGKKNKVITVLRNG